MTTKGSLPQLDSQVIHDADMNQLFNLTQKKKTWRSVNYDDATNRELNYAYTESLLNNSSNK